MPTDFTPFPADGDTIYAEDINQYAAPINALETAIESKGQPNGLASLDGAGKVVASQLPTPGATSLDALTDVVITGTPASGQVLKHNGTNFVNAALAASDVPNLDAAKITSGTLPVARGGTGATTAAAARTALGTNDAANITAGTLPIARGGTGATSAGAALTSLGAAPASHTHPISDVTNLQTSLDAKEDKAMKGANNGYASLDGTGKVPASQLPASSGGGASELYTGGPTMPYSTVEDLRDDIGVVSTDDFDAAGTNINNALTSLNNEIIATNADLVQRVPNTRQISTTAPLSGGGNLSANRTLSIAKATASVDGYLAATDFTAFSSKANASHTHSAADITSGQLGVARGGTGADLTATGGTGQVLKQSTAGGAVSVGALAANDMPSGIDAAKIGGGAVSNAEFAYLDGVTSSVQTQLNGKAATSHTHAAADITSGQIGVARGGTGADLTATGGTGQVLKQSTAGGAVSVGALAAADMPTGIDAAKIGGGAVSNAEFAYLDGVTSSVQTQLNGKAATSHTHAAADITSGQIGVARGGTGADLTATGGTGQVLKQSTAGGAVSVGALAAADMPSGIDATKIGGGAISNAEFAHLDGVTSGIQSQLDGKAASSHTHAAGDITSGQLGVARGGTGADLTATGGTGQFLKQSSAGAPVTVGTLAAVDMPSGIDAAKIGGGAVSNAEFAYLDGVTSGIQSQLNGRLPASGGTTGRIPYWSSGTALTTSASLSFSGTTLSTGSINSSGSISASSNITASGGISVSGQVYVPNMSNLGSGVPVYKLASGQLVWLSSNSNHKKDVSTITTTIDQIMSWRPVEFTWKQAFGENRDLGFIAEELDSQYPLATIQDAEWQYTNPETGEYAKDENGAPLTTGNTVPMGVKYDRAWIPMLAAVQDFYQKFQQEQAKVSELETRLAELESALGS